MDGIGWVIAVLAFGPAGLVATVAACVIAALLGVHPGYIVAIGVVGLSITIALIAALGSYLS